MKNESSCIGRDPNLFVNLVSSDLLCTVCHYVVVEPKESLCEHIYCESCSKDLQSCPVDNQPLQLTPSSKVFKRMISKLIIYCDHKNNGCDWQGEWSSLAAHLQQDCKFIDVDNAADSKISQLSNKLNAEIENNKKLAKKLEDATKQIEQLFQLQNESKIQKQQESASLVKMSFTVASFGQLSETQETHQGIASLYQTSSRVTSVWLWNEPKDCPRDFFQITSAKFVRDSVTILKTGSYLVSVGTELTSRWKVCLIVWCNGKELCFLKDNENYETKKEYCSHNLCQIFYFQAGSQLQISVTRYTACRQKPIPQEHLTLVYLGQ